MLFQWLSKLILGLWSKKYPDYGTHYTGVIVDESLALEEMLMEKCDKCRDKEENRKKIVGWRFVPHFKHEKCEDCSCDEAKYIPINEGEAE